MDKKKTLEKLKKKMSSDKNLPLREAARNLVFGEGNPNARAMFIGEGPGYWEDQKGRPFVGNAGILLNYLLQSIKLPRESVYITNIIHYRPPNNRDPSQTEISAFEPYLDEIIKIVDPKVVVTLGRFSMAKFLPNSKISAIHGKHRVVNWGGKEIIVIPMYHPAAALRNSEIKRQAINDFKVITEIFKKRKREEKTNIKQMELI